MSAGARVSPGLAEPGGAPAAGPVPAATAPSAGPAPLPLWREVALVAAKDLRIERRSRVTTGQVLPFALVVAVLFAFALDPDRGLLARAAPGLFWVAVLLAGLLAVNRAVGVELAPGVRDQLALTRLDPTGLFLGKVLAVVVELGVLQAVLGPAMVVLYDVRPAGAGVLAAAGVPATVAVAAAGTLYAGLAAGTRVRETLLPLLVLPVTSPVLLAATRAWEDALAGAAGDAWGWVALLWVAAVTYLAAGMLAFGAVWEDGT